MRAGVTCVVGAANRIDDDAEMAGPGGREDPLQQGGRTYALGIIADQDDIGVSKPAFDGIAELLLRDARGFGGNTFKIPLAKRAVIRGLEQAAVAGGPAGGASRS